MRPRTPYTPSGSTGQRGLDVKLGAKEKQALAILAKQAYDVMKRNGATDETPDEFRQRLSEQACGLRISEARRRHFNDIKAAFLMITGRTTAALHAADRSATEGVRQALHQLRTELKRHGLAEGYAEAICRDKFKRSLGEASEKQVWAIYYDVKKNRKRERLPSVTTQPA
jgi:hypothetical protein